MSNQLENETPSLAKVIKDAIEARLAEVHVSLPAEIVSYDGRKADVQILLERKYVSGEVVKLPLITNVPVIWPQTTDGGFRMPLEPGMTGSLVFSERSLDTWLVQGGLVSPNDPRKFALSDAQFVPGLIPFSEDPSHDPLAAVMRYKSTRIRLRNLQASIISAKITLGSDTSPEAIVLGNVLKSYLTQVETELNLISTDLTTLTAQLTALVAAITADAVTLAPFAPATVGAAPAITTALGVLTGLISTNTAARAVQKGVFLDSPATNILSQKAFSERS